MLHFGSLTLGKEVQEMDISVFFYILMILLIKQHSHILKPYVIPPFSSVKLPVFVNRLVDMLLIYPFLLVAAISSINRMIIFAGIIPEDPQKLAAIHITLAGFALRCAVIPFIALIEELFNLLMVKTIYGHMHFFKTGRFFFSILAASLFFGFLHAFNWGIAAAIALGISFIPVFMVTLYTGKIWFSVFAHMYLDILASARIYSPAAYNGIIGLFAFSALILTLYTCVRRSV